MKPNKDGSINVLDIFRTDPTPTEKTLGQVVTDVATGKLKPARKSLREMIADNLEKEQRTKARRDPFIDKIIRELRLN